MEQEAARAETILAVQALKALGLATDVRGPKAAHLELKSLAVEERKSRAA